MRVLHVISDGNIGGAGVLLTSLLRHFNRDRVQSVVALPYRSALAERILSLGVPVRFLRYRADRPSWQSVGEIARLLRAERIDLVHANAAINARIAGRYQKIRVVYTRHCCYPPKGIWRLSAVQRLGGCWNNALCDHAIATAEAARDDICRLGVDEGRVSVIINGSEAVREVSEEELEAARLAWGIPADAFVVGICARLEACKGHETFLRAAQMLVEEGRRRIRFLIVGEGSRRDVLEEMTHTLGLDAFVRFTGFLGDVAPAYRLMDLNVNCSHGTETSCLAISEGMSAGVPAIVSDYGGNRAMVGDSLAGRIYPVGDSRVLADAIRTVMDDPHLEAQMRIAARERYLTAFSPQRMTEELTRVYEALGVHSAHRAE